MCTRLLACAFVLRVIRRVRHAVACVCVCATYYVRVCVPPRASKEAAKRELAVVTGGGTEPIELLHRTKDQRKLEEYLEKQTFVSANPWQM